MAITLHVPGGKENPLAKDKVPAEPLQVQFPIRTQSPAAERRHVRDTMWCFYFACFWVVISIDTLFPWSSVAAWDVCWMLLLLFLAHTFSKSVNAERAARLSGLSNIMAILIVSVLVPWTDAFRPHLWLLTCLLGIAYMVSNGLSFRRRSNWADMMSRYLLPVGVGTLAVVSGMQLLRLTEFLPLLCLVLLVLQGLAFRRHTIERAVVGMLDKDTMQRFRRWQRLPKGLRPEPRLRGLFAAIRCFLSYNLAEVDVPGTFQSPAGGIRTRLTLTVSLLCILSMCLYIGLLPTVVELAEHSIEEFATLWPALLPVLFVVVCPAAALVLWTLTLFIFTGGFSGKALALKKKQISPSHWRRMMDRLQESKNPVEQESVWIGWVSHDHSPILYPTSQLFTHSWVVGASGSGKTAWMMGLVDQLIYRTDIQVVVVDCKAHKNEMLSVMKRAAAARTKKTKIHVPVKHFTLSEGNSTHLLDIFSQSWWQGLATPQRTGTILCALSLNYAAVYGASYFRDAAYEFLAFVLDRHRNVTSWVELIQRMQDAINSARPWELSKRCKDDGENIVWIVRRLASLSALNDVASLPQSVRDNAIDFSTGHSYFALNARENGLLTGEVGRLVTASVLASSYANPGRKTILVLDEWQLMVTRELEELLTQARDLGVGCVLANQSPSQLVTRDVDLLNIVESNASLQAWMKVTDSVGREQVRRLGGQERVGRISQTQQSGRDPSYTYSETLEDRIDGNLVSELASDASQFLLRLTDNAGYACYGDLMFAAKTMFHQTESQYKQACKEPWPAQSAETLVNRNALPRYRHNSNHAQSIAPKQHRRSGNRLGQPNSP